MGITISRVLSWVVIYLGVAIANYLLRSTQIARLLPGASCCRLGLPGCLCRHRHRWSLTPPFHPYCRGLTLKVLLQSNETFACLTPFTAVFSLLHLPSHCCGHPLGGTLPCCSPDFPLG